MRKLLCLCLLFCSTIALATAGKVMLEEPYDYDQVCILGANDVMTIIKPKTHTAVGTISTGSCYDAWSSGVPFSAAHDGIQNQKVTQGCEKRMVVQMSFSAAPGMKLDDWDSSPDGVTQNPCLHTNGKIYRKYDITY